MNDDIAKDIDLNYLWEELVKAIIILQRPVVQIQIFGIIFSIFLAWLISKQIKTKLQQRFPQLNQLERRQQKLSGRFFLTVLLFYSLTPSFCLIILSLLRFWFEQESWFFGYLNEAIKLIKYFWFYRFFWLALGTLFPVNSVIQYRYRLFAPLLLLFAIGNILNWFLDLQKTLEVTLIKVFNEPLTLKLILIIIAGLYFWIVTTLLLEKLLFFWLSLGKFRESRVEQAISLIFRYFLIGIGAVLIFGYIGVSPTAFAAITGGLSVGIGFGLKEVITNFISGIWLLLEGVLKPGDIITVGGKMSQVTILGIRATKVKIIQDNSEEIIPNQIFFTETVTTLTGSDRIVARSLVVRASYNCSPPLVIEILLQIAKEHPLVLQQPEPLAFAICFGESSVDFELKFWFNNPFLGKIITSELICRIWQAFAAHNIQIPYPQRDLHLISQNFQDPK
jgi:small-conductance mechanosensitive channel